MNKILVITSSISPKNSITNYAVDIFLEHYKLLNPNDQIEILNVNNNKKILTPLNSNDFSTFFDEESDILINQLKSANKIIISAGMVNFSIPTSLKSYFDNVLQVNKTFKYKYDGSGKSIGLLNPDVKVQLILAQGAELGWYSFALFDKYLEGILHFMGLKDINTIIYDGTRTTKKSSLPIEKLVDKDDLIKLASKF